jgi:NADPH-dependent ferric siderophore reductase
VEVLRTERLSPRMCRVTLAGSELEGLVVGQPAASVRVLLPPRPGEEPVIPDWAGNEFLLPGGRRPVIRTLTPRRFDPATLELDVDVVIHDGGAASHWAGSARPGDRSAVSGVARGYTADPAALAYHLAGDETAIPAISQLLESLPPEVGVHASIELAEPAARMTMPEHPRAIVDWLDLPSGAVPGEALVAAVREAELPAGTRVWAAGEAAAVQRIRRHLFEERGLPRTQATVRGYWKYGRAAGGAGED